MPIRAERESSSQNPEKSHSGPAARPRIALYSHDTMGMGHMRRNLLIAHALSQPPLKAVLLLVTGARRAAAFALPPGTDCLTLPSLYKEPDSRYRPRLLRVELDELVALRSAAIRAALSSFQPDLFIVDNVPRGAVRELDRTLEDLHWNGRTRCVLGLRDVLDEPGAVRRDWTRARNEEAVRVFYDSVWVYGDPSVYNLVHEYGLPSDIGEKVRYTGYLDQRARLELAKGNGSDPLGRLRLPEGRLALCLLGGGQDGARLGEAFAKAELPPLFNGVIVTGPFMAEEEKRRLQDLTISRSKLRVIEFLPEPMLLLQKAERVVSMGGYNTTCEALSLGKRTLIVPRTRPRTEQLIRATRLAARKLVEVLHPDDVSPSSLSNWLGSNGGPFRRAADHIDLHGLERIPGLAVELLGWPEPDAMGVAAGAR
ncbi:MAG TPA: glycosyltransferase [Thermoanaerobaculia bacterium]|nr:glycosyltransferase [Thermoanaerobaculia bacterium]